MHITTFKLKKDNYNSVIVWFLDLLAKGNCSILFAPFNTDNLYASGLEQIQSQRRRGQGQLVFGGTCFSLSVPNTSLCASWISICCSFNAFCNYYYCTVYTYYNLSGIYLDALLIHPKYWCTHWIICVAL